MYRCPVKCFCTIIKSCKTYTFRQPPLWDSPCFFILQNKGLSVHSPESHVSAVLSVLSVIVFQTQLTLRPAINIFQHNNSFYCPTISYASCQDTQMNEFPGGNFDYKFTRPLLHHNCLYSYSHSSCSTRCAWKWFVLRKKRGWLLCICSIETKKRVSWGFLRRSRHPGRSPTNLPCYFLLWPPSCLFHIILKCLVKLGSQLFSLKDNFHPSS